MKKKKLLIIILILTLIILPSIIYGNGTEYTCPECGNSSTTVTKAFTISTSLGGATFKCKKCKESFSIDEIMDDYDEDAAKYLVKSNDDNNMFGFIEEWIIKSIAEAVLKLSDFCLQLTSSVIYPENSLNVISSVYYNLYNISLSIAISLMLLMALYHGFNTYILWRDGNPEENPIEIITRYLFAIAIMLSFREIYGICGGIVEEIITKINQVLVVSTKSIDNIVDVGEKILGFVCTIIFFIVYIFQLIKAMLAIMSKGIELLIIRLGFPIACVSAVTPQASTFHAYVSSLIKAFFSVIVMKLLILLSVAIFFNNTNPIGLAWSISSLIMVNKGSALINQFIIPQQGGGGGFIGSAMSQAGGNMIRKMGGKIPGLGKMFGG